MNICIVSNECMGPNKGGVESVCYNLTQEIQKSGEHNISHLYYENDEGATIPEGITAQLPELSNSHTKEYIRNFLVKNQVDIVWNHSPSISNLQLIRQAAAGLRVKIVSIFHSTPYYKMAELQDRCDLALYRGRYYGEWLSFVATLLKYPLSLLKAIYKTRIFLRTMAEQSNVAGTLSDYYIEDYHKLSGKKYDNLHAVTNPIISTVSHNLTLNKKKNQVLVVARHEWKNKRLDRIIRIWRKVEASFPEWRLVMLGDGPAHDEYIKTANRLGVKNIEFTGKQSPAKFYEEAKIICMTSSWEGLPMVLLEAQQYGCVPIAYESFSALPDIIENEKNGFRIPAFNEEQFIEKLTYLMTHEVERERMAQACIQHANKFQVSDIVNRWLSIFSDLLRHSK